MRRFLVILAVLAAVVLTAGTIRNPHFWRTANQRGDALMRQTKYADAASAYTDPHHIGTAQYRNGDFKEAAKTFARVPGAVGAFDQGNAQLMHGDYDAAVASFDRALKFQPGWKDAEENKALAIARKAKIDHAGENRAEEAADAYKPDEIVFDQKGEDQKGTPTELSQQSLSDDQLRATWLRQVQTTPGDFLRAKFAYQAAKESAK